MARERSPSRDRAFKIWLEHNGDITNRQIAELVGEDEKKVAVWKQRDKWLVQQETNVVQQSKGNVVQQKKIGPPYGSQNAKGHGAPKGNKNAIGNRGGKAKPGNNNAVTHGLYAKYLPSETLEIADSLADVSPIDILWGNICIKYAAILRAQKIMYVEDKDDIVKELKTDGLNSTTYEVQFAWDRQAAFLAVQAKAMNSLSSMIKQYDELCKSELATEEQKARTEKLRAEVARIKDDDSNKGNLVAEKVSFYLPDNNRGDSR
jgi:uncharacterized protein YjcR